MQKWMMTEGKGVDEVARLCKRERMQVAGMQTSNTALSCSSTPGKGHAACSVSLALLTTIKEETRACLFRKFVR